MKGLLYKELCIIQAQIKSWLFAFLFLAVYGAVFKNPYILFSITAIVGLINALNTFMYDKMYRCEAYIGSLPVSRRKIVFSKYIFLFCLDVFFLLFTVLLAMLASLTTPKGEVQIAALLACAGGVGLVTVFLQALIVPAAVAFGPDKARFLLVIAALLPMLLLAVGKDHLAGLGEINLTGFVYALPFMLIFVIAFSIMISVAVYRKKEL